MYAVVRLGNHQYVARPGESILVEKLEAEAGSEVKFKDVLLVAEGEKIRTGKDLSATVFGTVQSQEKGKKITVFHKKRRKGFEKKAGHRQPYTRISIDRIEG